MSLGSFTVAEAPCERDSWHAFPLTLGCGKLEHSFLEMWLQEKTCRDTVCVEVIATRLPWVRAVFEDVPCHCCFGDVSE